MAKTGAEERQKKILELLTKNGAMRVVDIAEHFQVSRETIRRDLIALDDTGTVKKIFGSVMPVHDFRISPINARMSDSAEQKLAICQKALELIPPRSVLFLDTGSTALYMAELLKNSSGHTIITNSIPAANTLMNSGSELVLTGGSVNPKIQCTTGMQTIEFLEHLKIDAAILGTSGFDRHTGPTSNHFDDIQTKKLAVQNSMISIVIADSRKASTSGLMQYADWKNISYFISDENLPEETRKEIEKSTNIRLAPDVTENRI